MPNNMKSHPFGGLKSDWKMVRIDKNIVIAKRQEEVECR